MDACKKELLPVVRRNGLYSLPFEVFAHILELAFHPYGTYQGGWMNGALVNRYFRDAMFKVPLIWTTVYMPSFHPSQLERCRSLPLSISVGRLTQRELRLERCLDALSPHVQRWKSLSLSHCRVDGALIYERTSSAHLRLKNFYKRFRGVTFPALETLSINYGQDYLVTWVDDLHVVMLTGDADPSAHIRSFFSSWIMPALHHVEATGFIPILPSACHANLTTFSLKLTGGDVYLFNLRDVVNFLRPLVNLHSLSLEFMTDRWLGGEVQAVELPSLKVLSIYSWNLNGDGLEALLDAISCPNLRKFDLKAELLDHEAAAEYFDIVFPPDVPRWSDLDSLACFVEIFGEDAEEDPAFENVLETMCTRLPRLRHLALRFRSFRQPSNLLLHEHFNAPAWNRQVTLSTLRIEGCELFDTSFIVNLANIIKDPEFKTLEIHRCPNINIEFVQRMLPSSKTFLFTRYNFSKPFPLSFLCPLLICH